MQRTVITLLALLPAGLAALPAMSAPSRTFPRGEVVYRPECFGAPQEEQAHTSRARSGAAAGLSGGGSAGSRQANRAAQPPPSPPPSPSGQAAKPVPPPVPPPVPAVDLDTSVAAPMAEPVDISSGPSRAGRRSPGKKRKASVPAEAEAPAPRPLSGGDEGDIELTPSGRDALWDTMDAEVAASVGREGWRLDEARHREGERLQQAPIRRLQRQLDWGATVYLSNDDSMSLASAQRLLFAAANGLGLSPDQIRPHELLNYFSFDTVTPDPDQLFDVLASAEQDGDRLSVALAVKGAVPERQPLDLTLLVDRSCSMAAEGRMDYTRRGLTQMIDQLERGDRLDVVLFDDRACVPLQNYVVGRDKPALLEETLARMAPEGSTDLDLGLRSAYDVSRSHLDTHGRNRRVMVLTDALLNTGDVDHDTVSEIGAAFEDEGIRITGVGVGREFNDEVLDKLTEKGKGAYVYLGSEAVVDRVFGPDGFDSLVQTIAHDVRFALHLPDSLAMERFYGEEASTTREDVQPLNYYAGTSQLFLQDLQLRDREPVRSDTVELEITYRDAVTGEPESRRFRTTLGKMLDTDPHTVRKGPALLAWCRWAVTPLVEPRLGHFQPAATLRVGNTMVGPLGGDERCHGHRVASVTHPTTDRLSSLGQVGVAASCSPRCREGS